MCFSVSFAIPGEDISETAYDESESLPCEMTPLISGEVVRESAPTLQVVSIGKNDSPFESRHNAVRELAENPISDSLILLDHSLRC
jgi:hypothetical protein